MKGRTTKNQEVAREKKNSPAETDLASFDVLFSLRHVVRSFIVVIGDGTFEFRSRRRDGFAARQFRREAWRERERQAVRSRRKANRRDREKKRPRRGSTPSFSKGRKVNPPPENAPRSTLRPPSPSGGHRGALRLGHRPNFCRAIRARRRR